MEKCWWKETLRVNACVSMGCRCLPTPPEAQDEFCVWVCGTQGKGRGQPGMLVRWDVGWALGGKVFGWMSQSRVLWVCFAALGSMC